ncbi:hypothetical protein Clacol_007962 [Clathrus columnatus]|uniref:Uncharacterized protein n=1 Tax=Clathrus columnatus TaxID=1419009 RepID=A0AAV5AL95_9AGAM|nr:hypothetical protein Clacol_007962 [Clathrus columnatus]
MSPLPPAPPVDESLYSIRDEEKEFFKLSTQIDDDEELRKHVCQVQAEAYSLNQYPAYKHVLKLGKERPGAIYLEIGCAFGTDLRKLITDGYPRENVIASDIQNGIFIIYSLKASSLSDLAIVLEYYELGNKLFKTTPETCPFAFIPGDIFDSSVFDPQRRPEELSQVSESSFSLKSLTSLTPLHNRVSIIHISSVFHLFSPEKQQKLAHILASMLSPLPGSMILGKQLATDSGIYEWDFGNDVGSAWSYSTLAWKELWTGENGPFKTEEVDAQVLVEALPTEIGNAAVGRSNTPTIQFLIWSITRV